MFKKISHATGMETDDEEILFLTPFNYLFPEAARSAPCLLVPSPDTVAGLEALAVAMADPGTTASNDPNDSGIPAAMTYLGQFIDHDLTARTDRDSNITAIADPAAILPSPPDQIIKEVHNGRRPQLDLDSVFGDGPGLVPGVSTQSQPLYESNLKLRVFVANNGKRIDLPRDPSSNVALIADGRNDENLNISQLHTLFIRFYNKVYDNLSGSAQDRYVRARQLTRWAYQYLVVNDFLMNVCDPNVVKDTLANGPRFYGYGLDQSNNYIPLEFSVAAFRFGHTLIRPQYKLNDNTSVLLLNLGGGPQLLGVSGRSDNFSPTDHQLKTDFIINWTNYVGSSAQRTRKFDSRIAEGLFRLDQSLGAGRPQPILSHLAKSNLLRAYRFSIPTAQACCEVMGIKPIAAADMLAGETTGIVNALQNPLTKFTERTPLWYYILREGAVQQNGARLGELGSRIVAETIIGLLKNDPNSYLNNAHDPAVLPDKIKVAPGAPGNVHDLYSFLAFADAPGL